MTIVDIRLRLAASLLHAVPGIKLLMEDGLNPEAPSLCFTPCQLRSAVGLVLADRTAPGINQSLADLIQSPRLSVTLMSGKSKVFGGDIVGSVCCSTAIFAFATTVSPPLVRTGLAGRPRLHEIRTQADDLLGVTLVYLEVKLHHRLEPGWKRIALEEIQEAMVGCMRADLEHQNASALGVFR